MQLEGAPLLRLFLEHAPASVVEFQPLVPEGIQADLVGYTYLPYCPFHLRHFKDDPQWNQENTEQSKEPTQRVSPGWVDIGFVELERLVSHH